jgi:hypothetical protein
MAMATKYNLLIPTSKYKQNLKRNKPEYNLWEKLLTNSEIIAPL